MVFLCDLPNAFCRDIELAILFLDLAPLVGASLLFFMLAFSDFFLGGGGWGWEGEGGKGREEERSEALSRSEY